MEKFAKIAKALYDTLFPQSYTCDLCGIETFGNNLCPNCLKSITFNNKVTCPVCGRKTVRPEICLECKAEKPLFVKAASPLIYDGGAKTLIAKFKNGGGYLKEYFADLMAEKVLNFPKADCIIYVPMTKSALNKRGYNQSKLLAESLSKRIDVPVLKDALVKVKNTAEQKTLSRKDRVKNLESCFKVNKRSEVKGKIILLVDDVLTTGATCEAICKRLLKAGAEKIYFVTVTSVEFKQLNVKKKD